MYKRVKRPVVGNSGQGQALESSPSQLATTTDHPTAGLKEYLCDLVQLYFAFSENLLKISKTHLVLKPSQDTFITFISLETIFFPFFNSAIY